MKGGAQMEQQDRQNQQGQEGRRDQPDQHANVPSPEARRGEQPERPTATAPDSVDRSVPTAEDAGKTGTDAADPPRAANKHEAEKGTGSGAESAAEGQSTDDDPERDANEGADAFETHADAAEGTRAGGPERRDEDQITLDTPD